MEQRPQELARRLIGAARREGRTALDEAAAKQVLAAYGIGVPRSLRLPVGGQMPAALDALSPPYVLKIMSPDVLHKSDAGGVRLGLPDASAVSAARGEMTSAAARAGFRLDGFLVEETAPAGHDIVIGGLRDPSFGQTVMLGLGGIFVELLKDVSFRICPILPVDAREMIAELRGAPILSGARGGVRVDPSRVVELLMAVGGPEGLLNELADELSEVDLNPIIVSASGAVAVDARFVLAQSVQS
jgi:acetyl-CoA synthetase (ADP-forming)